MEYQKVLTAKSLYTRKSVFQSETSNDFFQFSNRIIFVFFIQALRFFGGNSRAQISFPLRDICNSRLSY